MRSSSRAGCERPTRSRPQRLRPPTIRFAAIACCSRRRSSGCTSSLRAGPIGWPRWATGRAEEARSLVSAVRTEMAERGGGAHLAIVTSVAADVELVSGNPAGSVEFGNQVVKLLEDADESAWLSTVVAVRGDAHYLAGNL